LERVAFHQFLVRGFLGVPAEVLEENPKVFLDQIHENDREKARESMHKLSNGEPDEIEYRVIHPERGCDGFVDKANQSSTTTELLSGSLALFKR